MILSKHGENITNDCRVQIMLSRNGRIGLGSELIRLAHRFEEGRHFHIDPITEKNACQTIGIFLTTMSCEVIINCNELGQVDNYLKE